MRKNRHQSDSRSPNNNKHTSYKASCQGKHGAKSSKNKLDIEIRYTACFYTSIAWHIIVVVVAAFIWQTPLLQAYALISARELAYILHKATEAYFSRE